MLGYKGRVIMEICGSIGGSWFQLRMWSIRGFSGRNLPAGWQAMGLGGHIGGKADEHCPSSGRPGGSAGRRRACCAIAAGTVEGMSYPFFFLQEDGYGGTSQTLGLIWGIGKGQAG